MNTKYSIEKFAVVFLVTASFTLLFQIQTNIVMVIVVSIILTLCNTLISTAVLQSKEKIIKQLYGIFIFVANIIILNAVLFVASGYGARSQTVIFYFALTFTLFITVYDYYAGISKKK